jgi:hypothetical protein
LWCAILFLPLQLQQNRKRNSLVMRCLEDNAIAAVRWKATSSHEDEGLKATNFRIKDSALEAGMPISFQESLLLTGSAQSAMQRNLSLTVIPSQRRPSLCGSVHDGLDPAMTKRQLFVRHHYRQPGGARTSKGSSKMSTRFLDFHTFIDQSAVYKSDPKARKCAVISAYFHSKYHLFLTRDIQIWRRYYNLNLNDDAISS